MRPGRRCSPEQPGPRHSGSRRPIVDVGGGIVQTAGVQPMGPKLAEGRDSEIFEHGHGKVLRVARDGRSLVAEAEIMRYVRSHGYPCPDVDDAGDGYLVMVRLEGPTMLEAAGSPTPTCHRRNGLTCGSSRHGPHTPEPGAERRAGGRQRSGPQTLWQGCRYRHGPGGGARGHLGPLGGDQSLVPATRRLRSVDREEEATMQRVGQVAGSRHPGVGGTGRRGALR